MARPVREAPTWLPALAGALAEALPRLLGEPPEPHLQELIAALSAALARGETGLDLEAPAPPGVTAADWPEGHRRALAGSALGREPEGPLVLEPGRIVWRRWLEQRQRVLAELILRAGLAPLPPPDADGQAGQSVEGDPDPGEPLDAEQRRAVEALALHRLVLLQGGPGTGKTSTVARMLRRLERSHPQARIHLAAPTGKAAARLRTACGGRHPCTTLHRLLQSRGEGFGRDRQHPLELDLLVVDEVSMVDLALMEAVLEALPRSARLVLVGDPAQLPPIAPGPLLLELQQPAVRQALGAAAVTLRTVHRNAGAIAEVADLLRTCLEDGGPDDPLAAIRPRLERLGPQDNLQWREAAASPLPQALLEPLQEHRRRLAELAGSCAAGDTAAERSLLAERDRLLVLSPRRRGRWGVAAIHRALLAEAATEPLAWPTGTPGLCGRNLPELGLANGDVGVLLGPDPEDGERRLLFGSGDGQEEGIRVHPAQLAGSLEPALALTVHKAQGSEAENVIVLLGPGGSGETADPRLLYTALTRARRRALLLSCPSSRQDINET